MPPMRLSRPPRRILVLVVPGFGDALLATPLLRTLRQAFPEARLEVMGHPDRDAMLAGNPDVDAYVTLVKFPTTRQYVSWLVRWFRRYDLAVTNSRADRGVLLLRCLARRCVTIAGAEHGPDWWKRLAVSAWVPYDGDTHMVLQNLRLADRLGVARSYEFVPPRDPEAPGRLDAALPFPWRDEPFAVLHVTAHATRKRWTPEGWAELSRSLADRGWRCVVTAGPGDDLAYVRDVVERLAPGAVNAAGAFALTDLTELIGACRLYVGPDTATTHLAACLGVPTLGLYGPGSLVQWSPWPRGYAEDAPPFREGHGVIRVKNVCVVRPECPCGLRYRDGCGRETPGESRCLRELPGAVVVEAVDALLEAAR